MATGKTTKDKVDRVTGQSTGKDPLIPSKKLMDALRKRRKGKGLRKSCGK